MHEETGGGVVIVSVDRVVDGWQLCIDCPGQSVAVLVKFEAR